MAKKDNDDTLDKNSRKRLEDLDNQWGKPVSDWGSDKLTLPDLRLLLERYPPLQALLRSVVATTGEGPCLPTQNSEHLKEIAHLKEMLARAQADLAQTQNQQGELNRKLVQCQDAHRQLQQKFQEQQQREALLEKQCRQTKSDLDRAERDRATRHSPELNMLRQDAELAGRMELTDLPADDTQALIRVVAVLSQRDNLERLWDALKERCETQNRQASAAERALLNSALTWCNHYWRTRPYTMTEAAPNTAYNFEQHLRSRNTVSGETIHDCRLPGIADGSHKIIRKTLVSTQ